MKLAFGNAVVLVKILQEIPDFDRELLAVFRKAFLPTKNHRALFNIFEGDALSPLLRKVMKVLSQE